MTITPIRTLRKNLTDHGVQARIELFEFHPRTNPIADTVGRICLGIGVIPILYTLSPIFVEVLATVGTIKYSTGLGILERRFQPVTVGEPTEEVKRARTPDGTWNDLSCPFMGSVLAVDQMPPMGGDAGRVRVREYPGGHMFYSRGASQAGLRHDVMQMYAEH